MTYLLGKKSHLYKDSIMHVSGPEVLVRLYTNEERIKFSPEVNKITGITKGKQDGSWYLVKD